MTDKANLNEDEELFGKDEDQTSAASRTSRDEELSLEEKAKAKKLAEAKEKATAKKLAEAKTKAEEKIKAEAISVGSTKGRLWTMTGGAHSFTNDEGKLIRIVKGQHIRLKANNYSELPAWAKGKVKLSIEGV